jgi:lipoate-protein ligase B
LQAIVPCGIQDKGVTSIAQYKSHVTLDNVKADLLDEFAAVFNVDLQTDSEHNIPILEEGSPVSYRKWTAPRLA